MMRDQITAHLKPHLVVRMHTIDLENKKRRNADNSDNDDTCFASTVTMKDTIVWLFLQNYKCEVFLL
jgi:hypothetical protein